MPEYVLCHVCEKFERRPKSEAGVIQNIIDRIRPCKEAEGKASIDIFGATIYIHRRILDLIIRASFLGSSFGLPTSILGQRRSRFTYGVNRLTISIDLQVHLVQTPSEDRHLFARSRHQVEFDLHENFENQIKAANIHACDHAHYRRVDDILGALQSLKDADGLLFESDLVRCEYCPTDFQIDIKRETHRSVFATTTITAWRDLGPRGLPSNRIWASQTEGFMDRRNFDRNAYIFGTENLKDVWLTKKVEHLVQR